VTSKSIRDYALSVALIAHTDSGLDTEHLRRFINAYQKVSPLSIGRVVGSAISLRLALVENLRGWRRASFRRAPSAMKQTGWPTSCSRRRSVSPMSCCRCLLPAWQTQGARPCVRRATNAALARTGSGSDAGHGMVREKPVKKGQSIEKIVQEEHQRQAAAQVTVGNIITACVCSRPWMERFFETVSLIDPNGEGSRGVYSRMDFATRIATGHVVERISKGAKKASPRSLAPRCGCRRISRPAQTWPTRTLSLSDRRRPFPTGSGSCVSPRLGERARRVIERPRP